MYSKIIEIADKNNLVVVDGTNITDLLEYRPGIMVNYDKNKRVNNENCDSIKAILYQKWIRDEKFWTCFSSKFTESSKALIKYSENS